MAHGQLTIMTDRPYSRALTPEAETDHFRTKRLTRIQTTNEMIWTREEVSNVNEWSKERIQLTWTYGSDSSDGQYARGDTVGKLLEARL